MPYGGTTPEQDKKIERCVTGLMGKGKEKGSAIAICKSSIMKGESVEDVLKKEEVKDMGSFKESLTFSFKEGSIDEASRTVRVCALAPCVSGNGRYYSPKMVESVAGSLMGKKSFADHDDRDTKNLIGRIVKEEYQNGKMYADIKISKASGVAKQTWEKIQDGTITDVSIAADGKTKRVKLGEQIVDEVTELCIHSVDFVTEGGVKDAKVMHVYEDVKDIPEISEVKEMEIKTLEELRASYAKLVEEIETPLKAEIATLKTAKETAEFKLVERDLAEYKEVEIKKLDTTDKVKDILRSRVSGKTNEEITTKLVEEFTFIKSVSEATKVEAKIKGVAETKEKKEEKKVVVFDSKFIKESTVIPENLKGRTIEILWNDGEVKAKEFLKSNKIEV